MDLFDKNKEVKKEDGYIHEQLSLDFDTAVEINSAQEKVPEPDVHVESKEAKKRKEKQEKAKKKKKKHSVVEVHLGLGVGSLGKFLQDMRVKNGYSISQVEQMTRIKAEYIELLEMEKLSLELPSVYVLAYARKLCSCYKVPEREIVGIVNELKDTLESSLPADLIENINIDYEVDEDNQKKIRHFAWLLMGGIIVFIALVGIAVFMLSAPAKPKAPEHLRPAASAEKFNPKNLEVLQPPIIVEATELPEKK